MSVNDIEEKMKAILENGGDTEADHGNADDLLCELANYLAVGSSFEDQVKRIVDTYNKIDKWYA